MVSWPAARLNVQQALAKLGGSNNRVLLQLGADESMTRDLPAFNGCFWDGLMLLCRTYQLQPSDDPGAGSGAGQLALESGAVSLVPRTGPLRDQADGALLVHLQSVVASDVHGLGGGGHRLEVAVRLRLEPRVDDESIARIAATMDSFASDDQGRQVAVEGHDDPRMDGPSFHSNQGRHRLVIASTPAPSGNLDLRFEVEGLDPLARSVTVAGQLRLQSQRIVHRSLTLAPGGSTTIGAGSGRLQFTLYDQNQAVMNGLHGAGLVVLSENHLLPSVRVFAPDGSQLQFSNIETMQRNGLQMLCTCPIVAPGPYRILVDDITPLPLVKLPLAVRIEVPSPMAEAKP